MRKAFAIGAVASVTIPILVLGAAVWGLGGSCSTQDLANATSPGNTAVARVSASDCGGATGESREDVEVNPATWDVSSLLIWDTSHDIFAFTDPALEISLRWPDAQTLLLTCAYPADMTAQEVAAHFRFNRVIARRTQWKGISVYYSGPCP